MPKAAAFSALEKFRHHYTDALPLAARHKREDKNDQLGEGKFAVTGEI